MKTGHNVLKGVIAVIAGITGGFFGSAGGMAGTIVGIITGLIVGYYYVHFTLNIKSPSTLVKIVRGTFNGTLAGLISGVLVHVPSLFISKSHGMFAGGGGLFVGAVFGVIVGTFLGFFGACTIASIREKSKSA